MNQRGASKKPPAGLWLPSVNPPAYAWPDVAEIATHGWYRLVPSSYVDEEVMHPDAELPPTPTPFDYPYLLDAKVVGEGHVRAVNDSVHVSADFLRVLDSLPGARFRASPIAHATPRAVRGRRLFAVELPGFIGTLDPSVRMFSRRRVPSPSSGHSEEPVSPVVFDGSGWTGDPVCWTEWLGMSDPYSGWRGLVASGEFVRALMAVNPRLIVESVEVHSLSGRRPKRSVSWSWPAEPASEPRSVSALFARIESTAQEFRHHLPPPRRRAPVQTLEALESLVGVPMHESLVDLLERAEGPALFGGAIGVLPCANRSGPSKLVGTVAELSPDDDIVLANTASRCAERGIVRPPGHVVFGWRTGSFPSFWSMDPSGAVHLLSTGQALLGPGVPVSAWLDDQVADLEYAWIHREQSPHFVSDWLGHQF